MARLTFPLTTGSILLSGMLAAAATVIVPPGPGTPIQDAINAANPGDTIRLLLGNYAEHLVVDKPVRIRGVRSRSDQQQPGTTLLSGSCAPGPVVRVASDNVKLRGILIVQELEGGVDVVGHTRVKMHDLFAISNCPGGSVAPDYNVEVSTRVRMTKFWGTADDNLRHGIGVRIAGTPAGGSVVLGGASIFGHHEIGVLLVDNEAKSVTVSGNYVNGNDRGIVLQNTIEALVSRNLQVQQNVTAGIDLDASSTGNQIIGNTIGGSITDVVDAGSGNCWRGNTFATGSVPACP